MSILAYSFIRYFYSF